MKNLNHFFPSVLVLVFLLSACSEAVVDKETDVPVTTNETDAPNDAQVLTVQLFAEMPFTLYKKGMDGWVFDQRVNENNDTLRTEQFSESLFHIVNSQYADATIYDKELKVTNGISTGMAKEDFLSVFEDYSSDHKLVSEKEHYIQIHSSEDFESSDRWEFHFHNDTLDMIKFDHYVDADYDFSEVEVQ